MLRWGVIGVGRAGAARTRAMAKDPRATPIIGLRGDPEAVGLAVADSLETLLDADIDAVAICSPNSTHPALVAAALRANKHVLCEFPVAGSAEEARQLFALAESLGRVLHVEHIELLGPAARWIRAHAASRQLTGGSCRFTTTAVDDTFSIAHANVARLHRLLQPLGPPSDVAVHERTGRRLWATLMWPGNPEHYAGQASVALECSQALDARRRTELVLEFQDGAVTLLDRTLMHRGAVVELERGPGLFFTDQLEATAEILDGTPPTTGRDNIIAVIALADQIMAADLRDPLPPDRFDLGDIDLDSITYEAG